MPHKDMLKKWVLIAAVTCVIAGSLVAGAGCRGVKEATTGGERPVYGGTFTITWRTPPMGFDDVSRVGAMCLTLPFTNEELMQGNWAKGKAGGYGTGECDWLISGINRLEYETGALAESWEINDTKDTITFHLRKGVKWHNKPPTNGRELTADDVVASLNRHLTEFAAIFKGQYPSAAASTQVYAADPYTVVMKCKPEHFAEIFFTLPDYARIFPKDALEQFGNMNDWKNNIGTGPFILTEYVTANMASFVRNPDYWDKNPVGPGKGDQLPYIDELKLALIPDESTMLAAFRAGEVDLLSQVDWEMAIEFLRMPHVKYVEYYEDNAPCIYMRTDKAPYSDKRVRQALHMALDYNKIIKEYYGGKALLPVWPITQVKEYANAYVPMDQMPRTVQQLFEYNPEKAKQLLAEAGYPNGFKTKIIIYNFRFFIDMAQMVKDMWAKIGVDVDIEIKDYVSLAGIISKRAYTDMIIYAPSGVASYWRGTNYSGPGIYNMSFIDDPVANKAVADMKAAFPDYAAMDKIFRQLSPYLQEQAYVVQWPLPVNYKIWWEWVKGYSGEWGCGYYNGWNFAKYIWVDQELKRSVLGR